jgi:hypothetical protein
MVNMGRDDELYLLGSSLDAAAINHNAKSQNNDESDKGTIIGLSIMGVAMVVMIVAAVVLRRRSSIKRGQSVPLRNLNESYRDHDEEAFHDEPAKPPTGLFQDHEPAGF